MVTIINQPSVQKDSFLAEALPDVIKNFAKIGGLNKTICFYKYHRHMDVCRAY